MRNVCIYSIYYVNSLSGCLNPQVPRNNTEGTTLVLSVVPTALVVFFPLFLTGSVESEDMTPDKGSQPESNQGRCDYTVWIIDHYTTGLEPEYETRIRSILDPGPANAPVLPLSLSRLLPVWKTAVDRVQSSSFTTLLHTVCYKNVQLSAQNITKWLRW